MDLGGMLSSLRKKYEFIRNEKHAKFREKMFYCYLLTAVRPFVDNKSVIKTNKFLRFG